MQCFHLQVSKLPRIDLDISSLHCLQTSKIEYPGTRHHIPQKQKPQDHRYEITENSNFTSLYDIHPMNLGAQPHQWSSYKVRFRFLVRTFHLSPSHILSKVFAEYIRLLLTKCWQPHYVDQFRSVRRVSRLHLTQRLKVCGASPPRLLCPWHGKCTYLLYTSDKARN